LNRQNSSWEVCCSFGLRMLTLQSKTKYECIVQAGMGELNDILLFISINLCLFPSKASPQSYYALAATSIGNVAKPRWCYTNELVDTSITMYNGVSSNSNPVRYAILANFKTDGLMTAFEDVFGQLACEAY
jgi:hypothetical protein